MGTPAQTTYKADAIARLTIGPVRVVPRPAAILWDGVASVTMISTAPLGLAGAHEADRARWLSAFRRMLDGLDSPLQVLIEVDPGTVDEPSGPPSLPGEFDDMLAADLAYAEQLAHSPAAHRRLVSLVTSAGQASRIEAALREMSVAFQTSPVATTQAFGQERANHFLNQSGWSRTWYVERLPGGEIEAGWLYHLLPPGLKLSLAWHANPLPIAWIVEYLQRQLTNMRASRLQEHQAGTVDPSLAGALPNTEALQRRLASSQEKAFHVSVYVTLTSPSKDQLESGAEKIESAARAMLCHLEPCTFRMLDAYLATRPAGIDRLARKRVLDSSALTTFFPWLDADLQQPGGLVIGRNRATGAPVLLDPFDQQRYANANIGVFGHSGAGKTYLLSTLAMGALARGTQVYIIDPEHEYGELARSLGGVDVRLALGSGHALNVLDLRPSDRRDESWIGPATADAVDLCAAICGGLDEPERALVEAAVRAAYRDVEQPVLGDVASSLPRESRVAAILNRWVHGSLGQIFSAPTSMDLEAPMVAFGMRELREEMVAPVHFLLAEALWTRIKRKDRRRMLVVDELGLLFEDATIRRFVVSLARRIRKYNGSLVFATQNPGDLLSSDQGAVVATNPAVLFFGAQRPGEAAKLQQAFQLSTDQRGMLEGASRGEFLIAAAPVRLSVHVQAPPWQEEAMRMAREVARPPPTPDRLSQAPERVGFIRPCSEFSTTG